MSRFPVLAAVSVFTIAFLGTSPMLSWPIHEWVRTSAEFHQQTAISLPVMGAVATFVAVLGNRPERARLLVVLLSCVGTAYLAGLAPLVITTAMKAQTGGPDLAVMLTGPLGLTAAVLCGYLIGLYWRSLLAVPAIAALLTVTTFLGTTTDAVAAVVPVQYTDVALGQLPSTPIVMYRLAFLVIVTVLAWWLITRRLAQPRDPNARSLLAAGAVVAVAVVLPVTTTPALFAVDTDPPRTCTDRAGVRYCVHSGHARVLDELVAGMSRLADRYGPLSERLDQTYDVALAGAADLGGVPERTLWFEIRPDRSPTEELPFIADLLAGVGTCAHGSTGPAAYAQQLGDWLMAEDTGGNAFHGIPTGVMHDWIGTNQPSINACAIDPELLPAGP